MIGREQRFHPHLSFFERMYVSFFGAPIVGLRIRVRNLSHLLPAQYNPKRVLDAGSGPGVMTFLLQQRYPAAVVVGVDLDGGEIAVCQAIARRANRDVQFAVADLRALPWSGQFDLAICVDILEHLNDDDQALHELFQALTPGGRLLLHVPSRYRRYPIYKKSINFDVPGHVRPGYDLDEIANKTRNAGFSVEECRLTYGFLESLANNVSYMITKARKRNKMLYAVAFPFLNALGWLGRHAIPSTIGAGIVIIGTKPTVD
ncbi:MAG: class I SAM-dependent methyltransferase [Candidatus Binatia bacterium]